MGEFGIRGNIQRVSSSWNASSDYEMARKDLDVPGAIGKRGPRNQLPPQLQEREYPNDRKPLKVNCDRGSVSASQGLKY